MHIPQTISSNTIICYKRSDKNKLVLNSDDFVIWHKHIPKRLSVLCLNVIIDNWQESPILEELILDEDVRYVFDNLPVNLPYELIKSKINDDFYWKRCYKTRWPNKLPSKKLDPEMINASCRNTKLSSITSEMNFACPWKEYFLQRHLEETLEGLKPEDYEPEQIKQLVDLCADCVSSLKINQLVAGNFSKKDHIPLGAVISSLPLLVELSLCFKQMYVGDNFSWHVLQSTENDLINLSRGLEKCNLQIFRIINSDIDCNKLIVLLPSLMKNKNLVTLDFSHCKISNKGAFALSKFLLQLPTLEELILSNNYIESSGVEALTYIISRHECELSKLDLSLNNIGKIGGDYITTSLINGAVNLRRLKLAGCGLNGGNAALISSMRFNSCLEIIDLSNNKLEEEIGKHILEMLDFNSTLKRIDIRMCGISPQTIFAINVKLSTIRKMNNYLNFEDAYNFMSFNQEKLENQIITAFDIKESTEELETEIVSYQESIKNEAAEEIEEENNHCIEEK